VVEDYNLRALMEQSRQEHKHGVARILADAGAGELRRQLEYKSGWNGVEYVSVEQGFPSMRKCSVCGHVLPAPPKNGRFACSKCKADLDSELNAALNLKKLQEKEGVVKAGSE
jgi:putative transposase